MYTNVTKLQTLAFYKSQRFSATKVEEQEKYSKGQFGQRRANQENPRLSQQKLVLKFSGETELEI